MRATPNENQGEAFSPELQLTPELRSGGIGPPKHSLGPMHSTSPHAYS